MKKSYDVNTGVATFTFEGYILRTGSGENEVISNNPALAPVTFTVSKMSPENEQAMLGHGVLARVGDSAALSRTMKDGTVRTVTETMRRDEILAMVAHYESGTTAWNMTGAPRAPVQNPLWLQIAAKRGVEYGVIAAEYAKRAMDELAELG